MFKLMNFVQPTSIDEAYSILMEKNNNTLIGGSAFLRMGKKRIGTAIELSKLNLRYIREDKDEFEIGAMTTFRDIEIHKELNSYFDGVIGKSLKGIIGIQFRNVVTIGATLFSRYGFSDLITSLLALNVDVNLYKGGRMKLCEFMEKPYEKDMLLSIYIKKDNRKVIYKDIRRSSSDYPILNLSVSKFNNEFKIVIGARPVNAIIAKKSSKFISENPINEENLNKMCQLIEDEVSFGSDMRASALYRREVCKTLLKRAVSEV
ncbi:FAD binding domain-containing protein [Clostridium hydrogeniformans]|uniref:FAD binding domain-containing protein n=1 Tax=Clostridium hydrogeniformans TaxID=349933 RepID=UPI000481D448|nr:FAD binding domain-containing protein [Clostridium hydrogeniformans]